MVKKILSIDGGGMHGVVPLAVCIAIEQRKGKKLKDIFDLFVGTSTGALISAAALRGIYEDENGSKKFGISAENILKIYFERAEDIFGSGAKNRLNIKIPILNVSKYPEYKAEGLKKVVDEVFGGGSVTRMEKAEKLLSISAYDVKSRVPHFFRSWQEEYKDLEISDAVMASSSVPTTHPLYKIKGKDYTDGGVFASNPAMFALIDALSLFGDEDLILVSLGTGISPGGREQGEAPKDKALWWLRNIFNIFLDGQGESSDQALTALSKVNQKLNYFRFNIDLPKKASSKPDVEVLREDHQRMKDLLNNDSKLKAQFEKMISML